LKPDSSIARRVMLTVPHLVLFLFWVWLLFGGEQLPVALAVLVVAAGLYVVGESAWRFWHERGQPEEL
jgi:hypothetical protein